MHNFLNGINLFIYLLIYNIKPRGALFNVVFFNSFDLSVFAIRNSLNRPELEKQSLERDPAELN